MKILFKKAVISPVASSVTRSFETARKIFFPTRLDNIVRKSLENAQGTYAISIKNLKNGETYNLNQDKAFASASLYKLWVMGEAFSLIHNGKLDPNKVLTADVNDLNRIFGISTESAELKEGEVSARVQDALTQMITISSNYSALLLAREIKVTNISAFLSNYGFSNSKTGNPPVTTAADIADFYEKLYKGRIADSESTKQMVALLKAQTLNDRIPKYLPDAIDIAHKTGELDGFKHDAGIVFTPKGDYILVILSKTDNPQQAAETEALLSKAVYEYFENE